MELLYILLHNRDVGRWFGKRGLYRSIGKDSMISVYKIEPIAMKLSENIGGYQPLEPPWFLHLCIIMGGFILSLSLHTQCSSNSP